MDTMKGQTRPDPDKLLARLKQEERESAHGRLKIFFSYAPGVGKTYAMLMGALAQVGAGVDLVVGYVETHHRPETEALLHGLDLLPPLEVEYRSMKLREFNLDAALERHPAVLLLDEFAHTNAPGLRHTKRWQDVEELLSVGINVYTTLNVQHLESLSDVIRDISGIQVRETIPDSLFDEADSVEFVDLPQAELLQRLRKGKVYVPAQATKATENFFKGPNLASLREIALRRTADRVHARMTRLGSADCSQTCAISETLLLYVGPGLASSKAIRTSKRMAASLNAHWMAASVAAGQTSRLSEPERASLTENLRLAERLGAETVTLAGNNIADELVAYARTHKVTKIVIAKSREPWRHRLFRASVVDQLLERSDNIAILVI